jgi:hypothetical protein
VKFHFDKVEGLGTYIEVEAIDDQNTFTLEELKSQCYRYFDFFGLREEDLIDKSYSDLLFVRPTYFGIPEFPKMMRRYSRLGQCNWTITIYNRY